MSLVIQNKINGFVLVDKPTGPTSHDVVDHLRRVSGIRQIGHAGTLDPFAEGLLILLVGDYTKRQREFMGLGKRYEAVLKLGVKSDTDDLTGKLVTLETKNEPTIADIEKVLNKFRGKIKQIPPQFSAIKLAGKKAYEKARAGVHIALEPRDVEIYSLDIASYKYPLLNFSVHCSKGTYIRALARDIGQELGTGAILTALKRTAIGSYGLKDAVKMPDITKDNWNEYLRTL